MKAEAARSTPPTPSLTTSGTVLADPYTKMERNVVRLRVEVEALLFVRDYRGAYVIS